MLRDKLIDGRSNGTYLNREVTRNEHNIIDWLNKHIPETHESTIVHGDFRLGNLIYHKNNNIKAVLDWELSTIGDPLADFDICSIPFIYQLEKGME